MVVRFVGVIRVLLCARVSRVYPVWRVRVCVAVSRAPPARCLVTSARSQRTILVQNSPVRGEVEIEILET